MSHEEERQRRESRRSETCRWLHKRTLELDHEQLEHLVAWLCGYVPEAVEEALSRLDHPAGGAARRAPNWPRPVVVPLRAVPEQGSPP